MGTRRSYVGHLWRLIVGSLILVGVACRQPARAGANNPHIGVIESYESPADADALGIGWTRVRFNWARMQPNTAQEWITPVSAAQLATELAAGRQVIGLLIDIPAWARDERELPRGLWLPHDDPNNTWAAFVRQTVTHYAGQIDHWVIWNEPDIWDFDTPGHTWEGSEADFAQLMRVAYHVIHSINPDSVIHLAAMTYFWDANFGRVQYLERLLAALDEDPAAAAHGYYFDFATAHLYFQPGQIYDIVHEWRAILAAHGLEDKPWWVIETNAPPHDDPTWPVASVTLSVYQVEQAAYIPQALALALAAGAERAAIYKLKDTPDDRAANPEPFGLVRLDGSRRPAFDTLQVATQQLQAVQSATRERWDAVGQIRLDQTQHTTRVIFSRLPAPQVAEVPATAPRATLISQTGEQQTLRPQDGIYRVELPPAVCSQPIGDYCMIGGPVFYLVQAADPTSPATVALTETLQPNPLVVVQQQTTQSPFSLTTNTATVRFPEEVTFQAAWESDQPVISAELIYTVGQTACVAASVHLLAPIAGQQATWTWEMIRSGNPPPGVTIQWRWLLTTADGQTHTTPETSITLADNRFDWRTVATDRLRLHWYAGDEVGPTLLAAAEEALRRLEEEMGIQLQNEVQLYIYGTFEDMRAAVLYIQDWAGGVAFHEYDTILIGVPPAQVAPYGVRTVAHELAHLVVAAFGRSCIGGSRPTWLNEGLAMLAEGEPDSRTQTDLEEALAENSFTPLRSLNGAFPAHNSDASLAYSQSYSVTRYLLETYGQAALQELLLTLAAGEGYDDALFQVYGFNTDELETRWRAAIGAAPRAIPPTPTPVLPQAIPTAPLVAPAAAMPTPTHLSVPTAPSETPSGTPEVCGVGLAPLAFVVWRRRRRRLPVKGQHEQVPHGS